MKHLKYLFASLATIAVLAIFSSCSSDTDDKKEHDNVVLPALTKGDEVAVRQYEILKKKTKPHAKKAPAENKKRAPKK